MFIIHMYMKWTKKGIAVLYCPVSFFRLRRLRKTTHNIIYDRCSFWDWKRVSPENESDVMLLYVKLHEQWRERLGIWVCSVRNFWMAWLECFTDWVFSFLRYDSLSFSSIHAKFSGIAYTAQQVWTEATTRLYSLTRHTHGHHMVNIHYPHSGTSTPTMK